LKIAGDRKQFPCDHCGNIYLLERNLQDLALADREQLLPLTTYTHQLQQWLKVGAYEIFLHNVQEEKVNEKRVIYLNVEYRNSGSETLSCRRTQWILFDTEGYTYDSVTTAVFYEGHSRPALSGERFISPGMKVRGWVAFEIPPTAMIERVQFLTGHLTTKTAEFLLKS